MVSLTPQGEAAVLEIAQRHGLSRDATVAMLSALYSGGGTMAQFNIPELGGSGQWMRGGMTMVGNMFDYSAKARVDALCADLAQLLATSAMVHSAPPASGGGAVTAWWPADLGTPSATGSQNDLQYAIFPTAHRLAILSNGALRLYDTGTHQIGGVQQQSGSPASVSFTSQRGTFDISSLARVPLGDTTAGPSEPTSIASRPQASPVADALPAVRPSAMADAAASGPHDPVVVVAAIEALAGLHERGILSDAEFAAKKAELLGRL
jgi:hypothetical protein